ncbi:fibrinogen-like YCDxxxxGGGW domain-containing protein [Corallococcus aberystwythensis]|uniref:Fibrinogen C-terminal domain-containing protein n=1 Tax=Corallococcus aberystwythensis TaxID=2316722 RepID=A0A3A8QEB3_9BACT|nr:fibrinogen-like YCDxxxxGGGW domain-containing protein [Corallococcus aberystwythensis]RKH63172.1 hypothetical protein D7W81_20865 [Corallococcus aberystwythensis]
MRHKLLFTACLIFPLMGALLSTPAMADPWYGETPDLALRSCQHLYAMGVRRSGVYFLKPDGTQALTTYCDMETQGGGWAMVYNSVLGTNTTDFWNIPYADRLGRRGRASLDSNFYDGSLYTYRKTEFVDSVRYMDVVEDLRGKTVILFTARIDGFNTSTMRFQGPQQIGDGSSAVYSRQFASGWASPDYDGDATPVVQCSANYANVTQHYDGCWVYNLGADAELPVEDGRVGPHLNSSVAVERGLVTDGTVHTRVRRITRFVRW